MKEIWKDVTIRNGIYKDNYAISNLSRVKNKKTCKILKQSINGRSHRKYYYVCLCVNNKKNTIAVHVILANEFIGERPKGYVIDHINHNPLDNSLNNLQYVTNRKNLSKDRNNKYTGAYLEKKSNKWRSQINVGGKDIYLGLFDTQHEAHLAYKKRLSILKND